MRAAPLPTALLLALIAAGCLATAPAGAPDGADAPGAVHAAHPRLDLDSRAQTRHLGLAWYADVPRERVAPRVAEGFQLTPCFGNGSRADVIVVVDETRHLDAPGGPATVRLVALLTCATPPDRFARVDANEPPWYDLGTWADTPDHAAFYGNASAAPAPARVTVDATPGRGFTVSAADARGQRLVAGRFAAPADAPGLTGCAAEALRGRIVTVAGDGRVGAVDWNKTEATCTAAAALSWPADSPLAGVLGAQRPPVAAFQTFVDEARYKWWTLGVLER